MEEGAFAYASVGRSRAPHGNIVIEGCPCLLCYEAGEEEEQLMEYPNPYAFIDHCMRIRPGCHRRTVRCWPVGGDLTLTLFCSGARVGWDRATMSTS